MKKTNWIGIGLGATAIAGLGYYAWKKYSAGSMLTDNSKDINTPANSTTATPQMTEAIKKIAELRPDINITSTDPKIMIKEALTAVKKITPAPAPTLAPVQRISNNTTVRSTKQGAPMQGLMGML